MRISTPYQFGNYTSNIAQAQERYLNVQNQIGTGKKIFNPSDDPVGTATIVNLRSLRSAAERYQGNLTHGESILKFTESALSDTHSLVQRAYQLAVAGANAATDQTGREAMVNEVTELQRRLVDLGNTRGPNNEYIFSGQAVSTKPFLATPPTLTFNGDTNDLRVESAPNETLKVNSDGSQTYIDIYAALETLKNNLQGGNTGAISGVSINQIQDLSQDVLQLRGNIGARLQQVAQLKTDYTRRMDEFSAGISGIEDVDMSEAVVEYRLAETAYTAALNVASQGFRLSLMDFIR